MKHTLAIGALTIMGILACRPGLAQTPAPTPSIDSVPEKIAPTSTPTPAPAENLSQKLDRSNGVVQPKDVDPKIDKGAPSATDPNVIKPPGASSAPDAPQAK